MANEAPKIGLDNVVIAKVLSDSASGITYDTPIALKGAVNATVNPNSDVAVDYADNGPFFSASNRGNTELNLEMIDVDPDVLAMILGQKKVNGVTVETVLDQSADFAVGFRVWLAGKDANGNNRYQYFWYAKGKFSVPETGGETKQESLNFGHINVTAQFVQTQFIPDGQESGTICTHIRTDDPTASASLLAGWFNAPVISVSQSLSAVTVSGALSNGKLVLTGSKGSAEAFTFAESSAIVGESIVVFDDDGKAMEGTLAFGGTTTAPTITFTKAETETGDITAVTVTSGLKDNNGVSVTPYNNASLS